MVRSQETGMMFSIVCPLAQSMRRCFNAGGAHGRRPLGFLMVPRVPTVPMIPRLLAPSCPLLFPERGSKMFEDVRSQETGMMFSPCFRIVFSVRTVRDCARPLRDLCATCARPLRDLCATSVPTLGDLCATSGEIWGAPMSARDEVHQRSRRHPAEVPQRSHRGPPQVPQCPPRIFGTGLP